MGWSQKQRVPLWLHPAHAANESAWNCPSARSAGKDHHGDAINSVKELGFFEGSIAIATSKKELKQLMKSEADVVYEESKGKLYLNDNGTAKDWGAKQVGGLLALLMQCLKILS